MFTSFPFSTVLNWYQKNGRHDLPWRQIYGISTNERLYKVWIAEVMLQQTQVDRVIGYYTRFLGKYPTIESLAQTTYDELFPYYQGLGYYGRARRMIELAKSVVEEYGGIFPDNFEKLRKLPGIGKYTAQALLAFGYDEPVLAMDANLEKIFKRYYYGSRYFFGMQSSKFKVQNGGMDNSFEALVIKLEKQLIKDIKKNPKLGTLNFELGTLSGRAINNALMDFGALISTSWEKLDKENYPLKNCKWFKTEGEIEKKSKDSTSRSQAHLAGMTGNLPPEKGGTGGLRGKLLVFLHESHKSYWSSLSSSYEPFLIEPTGSDDRRTVQDYFSATFGLEVSVRPSFGSGYLTPGLSNLNPGVEQPVKLFHAQIQTGNLKQKTFSKTEKEEWVERNIIA